MTPTAGVAPFIVGGVCAIRYRPPRDRRRIVRVRGTVVRITAHTVELERTVIDPDVPGRPGTGERTVIVAVRLVDIVDVTP